jgi:hypothetical protein
MARRAVQGRAALGVAGERAEAELGRVDLLDGDAQGGDEVGVGRCGERSEALDRHERVAGVLLGALRTERRVLCGVAARFLAGLAASFARPRSSALPSVMWRLIQVELTPSNSPISL